MNKLPRTDQLYDQLSRGTVPWPTARRGNFPAGVNFPFREPPCPGTQSLLPEWLRSPKPSMGASASSSPRPVFPERSILPSTSLNNEAAAAEMLMQQPKLSFGVPWDKAESKKVEIMSAPAPPPPPPEPQPQQQQQPPPPPPQCSTKLFGFNLAAPALVCPARSHVSDSEGSGPWPPTDDPSPMSVDQHSNKFAAGTSSGVTVPMRTGTKVS